MNRKTALDTIKVEYAKHGKMTPAAMRAYTESRIGFRAFTDARQAGTRIYIEEQRR